MGKLIKIKQAAEILEVCTATLQRWEKAGKIKAMRNKVNNHRLYDLDDINKFKKDMYQ